MTPAPRSAPGEAEIAAAQVRPLDRNGHRVLREDLGVVCQAKKAELGRAAKVIRYVGKTVETGQGQGMVDVSSEDQCEPDASPPTWP
jgi:hypothetical protein